MPCVGFGWFVGLSQFDINWSTIWSTYMLQCNEPSTRQLSNFGSLTTNTNTHKQNACSLLQGCGFEPSCSQIFFFQHLIWEVANGAKAGLKLRLLSALPINSYITSDRITGLNNCLDCFLAFSSSRRNESYIALSCHNFHFCKWHQMPKFIYLNDTSMLLGGT